MNRRTFAQSLAAAALAGAVPSAPAAQAVAAAPGVAPYPVSVMLWTVFTGLPIEERLAKVAEAGYSLVELVREHHGWSEADYARVNAVRKRLGIKFDVIAGIQSGVADPSARDAFLAELKTTLAAMEKLDCPAVIALSGNLLPGLSRPQQHQAAVETLKRAAELVEGRQIDGQPVRILLECIDPEENPKYFLATAAEGIEIVRAVNHPQVQFLYDIYHEQIAEGNLIEKLDKHIDVIGLVHVADVPGRHQPGTGEINYANVYRKLAEKNYRKVVAMEFRPAGDPVAVLRAAKNEALRAGAV